MSRNKPGFSGGLTHSEIALQMGIKRQRVAQIEETAMNKLRRAFGVMPVHVTTKPYNPEARRRWYRKKIGKA